MDAAHISRHSPLNSHVLYGSQLYDTLMQNARYGVVRHKKMQEYDVFVHLINQFIKNNKS